MKTLLAKLVLCSTLIVVFSTNCTKSELPQKGSEVAVDTSAVGDQNRSPYIWAAMPIRIKFGQNKVLFDPGCECLQPFDCIDGGLCSIGIGEVVDGDIEAELVVRESKFSIILKNRDIDSETESHNFNGLDFVNPELVVFNSELVSELEDQNVRDLNSIEAGSYPFSRDSQNIEIIFPR